MPNKRERITGETLYREMKIDKRAESIDEEARTIDISISSEDPYGRWGLIEILGHDGGEVRLDRLNNSAAFLEMHDMTQQIGVIVAGTARVDDDKILRATVRFSKNPKAEEVWRDVLDEIRTKISVGYRVIKYEWEIDDDGNETNTYRVVDWEPMEASSVSVAADDTVGIGKSIEVSAGDVPAQPEPAAAAAKGEPQMDPTEKGSGATEDATTIPAQSVDVKQIAADAVALERQRVAEIEASVTGYPQHADLAEQAKREDWAVDKFRLFLLDAIKTSPVKTDVVGMSEKEGKQYSILRVIRAQRDPSKFADAAGFEREVSDTLAKKIGKEARGFLVPGDVGLRSDIRDYAQRILSVTSDGELKGTDHRGDLFIDVLRNVPMVQLMGATILTDLVGDVSIPRKATGSVMAWLETEGDNVAASEPTFDALTLAPKEAGLYFDWTRKLWLQSAPSVEQMARDDIAAAIALGTDLAAIAGTGATGQPEGILNVTGIGDVAMGTNGDEPTWAKTVANIAEVSNDNALMGNLGWLINSKTQAIMETIDKGTDTGKYIFDADSMDAMGMFGRLAGYRCGISNQVPSTLTKGSATSVCSAAIFGNWRDLVIAQWGAVDIVVSTEALLLSGGARIVAHVDMDIGLRHVQSFSAIQDILTVIT